jgi:hypothetical protein
LILSAQERFASDPLTRRRVNQAVAEDEKSDIVIHPPERIEPLLRQAHTDPCYTKRIINGVEYLGFAYNGQVHVCRKAEDTAK